MKTYSYDEFYLPMAMENLGMHWNMLFANLL